MVQFRANAEYLQIPATIEEELLYSVQNYRHPELDAKIRAKRICYDRYKLYIEQEIGKEYVAPIR